MDDILSKLFIWSFTLIFIKRIFFFLDDIVVNYVLFIISIRLRSFKTRRCCLCWFLFLFWYHFIWFLHFFFIIYSIGISSWCSTYVDFSFLRLRWLLISNLSLRCFNSLFLLYNFKRTFLLNSFNLLSHSEELNHFLCVDSGSYELFNGHLIFKLFKSWIVIIVITVTISKGPTS